MQVQESFPNRYSALWHMSAHASQAFSIAHCTNSEDLPRYKLGRSYRSAILARVVSKSRGASVRAAAAQNRACKLFKAYMQNRLTNSQRYLVVGLVGLGLPLTVN